MKGSRRGKGEGEGESEGEGETRVGEAEWEVPGYSNAE